jgi:AraC-like DNA-binding protein
MFSPYVHAVASICQVIAGDAITWVEPPDEPTVLVPFAASGTPACRAEALAVRSLLLDFTERLGRQIHAGFHRASGSALCDFDPRCAAPLALPLDAAVPDLLACWTRTYRVAFIRAHRVVSARVKARLQHDAAARERIATLARSLGYSTTVMQRRFAWETGESVVACRTRIRTMNAIRLLRCTDLKVEVVSREVGWRSKKDLYRAFERLIGQSPAAVRGLPDQQVSALLERLKPARFARQDARSGGQEHH